MSVLSHYYTTTVSLQIPSGSYLVCEQIGVNIGGNETVTTPDGGKSFIVNSTGIYQISIGVNIDEQINKQFAFSTAEEKYKMVTLSVNGQAIAQRVRSENNCICCSAIHSLNVGDVITVQNSSGTDIQLEATQSECLIGAEILFHKLN